MMKRRRQRGEIDGVTRCVCQHTVQTVCGGSVSVWDVCVCTEKSQVCVPEAGAQV